MHFSRHVSNSLLSLSQFEEASTRALENAKKELECYRKEMNELKLKVSILSVGISPIS